MVRNLFFPKHRTLLTLPFLLCVTATARMAADPMDDWEALLDFLNDPRPEEAGTQTFSFLIPLFFDSERLLAFTSFL